MGEMRDSDWSGKFLLRSDWLPIHVAPMTTDSVFRIDLSLEFQFFTDSTKFLANEYLANLLFKGG